jgi:trimeric autotransporter adhesin
VTTATNAVTLAIGTNPSAGVLACTNTGGLTVTSVSGVANFTGCSITKAGTGYTLAATSSPVLTPPVNANAFTITAGAASQLVFTTQPVGGVLVGGNFAAQPKVSVEDANSNVVTSDTGSETLSIAVYTAGNGGSTKGTLACTTNPVNAVAGVATFAGCKINGTAAAGTYTLSVVRSGLTSATSSGVVINAGVASQLVFTTQPVGGVLPATNFATQPKVSIEDAAGNVVTTDTGTVTLSIASYVPGNGGTIQGTPVCTTNPVNAVAGVATFAGCKINGVTGAGTYTLSAARSGLASGISSNVVIT